MEALREIVFDTETTGFNYQSGDKLVEIGAIELVNHIPTGRIYHQYINPEREVPEDALKVHGLTYEFLKDYPTFDKIAQDFIDFIGEDGILVAHNASFDVNFVNYQLEELGFETYSFDRVVDTLEIAKSKFPGQRNSLDVLCKRFGVDNSKRTFHGALLDAELLADVYLELLGGAEPTMDLATNVDNKKNSGSGEIKLKREYREPRKFVISEEEFNNHRSFLEKNIKNPIWLADEVVKEEEGN